MRFPDPTADTEPRKQHSRTRGRLLAMIVLRRLNDPGPMTTTPAPAPVLSLPLIVELSTVTDPPTAKIAPPASPPLCAPWPPATPRTTKLPVNVLFRTVTFPK